MIAISTFRPLGQSAEYDRNQIKARESWRKVFDRVVYFGEPEDRLGTSSDETFFVTGFENPPRMVDVMARASLCLDPRQIVAIINADIVVDPRFLLVEKSLKERHAKCAFSLRWQKNPQAPTFPEKVTDMGLDCFCALAGVWAESAQACPTEFRMGKILWDTWLLQLWAERFNDDLYDFTASRVIFHPLHGDRKDQSMTSNSPYLKKRIWPENIIQI